MAIPKLQIEGFASDELASLDDLESYAATGRPIVFQAGSAEILAQFSIVGNVLSAELALVDHGGEGVLRAVTTIIEKSAINNGLSAVEWWIYARNCAFPNPKLDRILNLLGFEVRRIAGGSKCYWKRVSVNDSLRRRHG